MGGEHLGSAVRKFHMSNHSHLSGPLWRKLQLEEVRQTDDHSGWSLARLLTWAVGLSSFPNRTEKGGRLGRKKGLEKKGKQDFSENTRVSCPYSVPDSSVSKHRATVDQLKHRRGAWETGENTVYSIVNRQHGRGEDGKSARV